MSYTLVEKVFPTDKSAMLFDLAVRTIWSGERGWVIKNVEAISTFGIFRDGWVSTKRYFDILHQMQNVSKHYVL